ncbi:50S ribosomal protein L29 [Candidatus Woesearchaeota archaeon]|nr:50S ribosomal protein L29 [Candidatus Woesearchaeota archaeon]
MKIKELRGLSSQELNSKLGELYKELMKDNAQVATGTIPKNPGKIGRAKKTIAQIKTVLAQQEVRKNA